VVLTDIRSIKIEVNFADSLLFVHADKVQLQQVIINLIMNAVDVTMDVSKFNTIITQTKMLDGDRVLVAVSDLGPGIDEELAKIFEPFFTTKRSGLGMGLSLCRSIIESHGGHIWAENNPEGGATFFFDLPRGRAEQ
jgi:two-component system sensor kinase FixL